jgi:hypothetical protein
VGLHGLFWGKVYHFYLSLPLVVFYPLPINNVFTQQQQQQQQQQMH